MILGPPTQTKQQIHTLHVHVMQHRISLLLSSHINFDGGDDDDDDDNDNEYDDDDDNENDDDDDDDDNDNDDHARR